MYKEWIPKRALIWFSENEKRKQHGRLIKSWSDRLSEDVQNNEMTWDDFREIADERALWKSYVTQYATARGSTKVYRLRSVLMLSTMFPH